MLQERSANGNSGSEIDEILMFPIAAGLAGLGDDGASGDDLAEVKDKELSPYLLPDIVSLLAVERQETYGVLKVTEGCLAIPSEMIQILEVGGRKLLFLKICREKLKLARSNLNTNDAKANRVLVTIIREEIEVLREI